MGFWKKAFELTGWKVDLRVDLPAKCVFCVAPHTSNLDFIIGILAYRAMGRKANFLMKEFWFFFPLKYLLRALGGIPVRRRGGKPGNGRKNRDGNAGANPSGHGKEAGRRSLTEAVVERFRESSYLNLAVTPEGTRSANPHWKTGFLAIAREAGVPVILAGEDFSTKTIVFATSFLPGPDLEKDLEAVKAFYADKRHWARYPSQFEV